MGVLIALIFGIFLGVKCHHYSELISSKIANFKNAVRHEWEMA